MTTPRPRWRRLRPTSLGGRVTAAVVALLLVVLVLLFGGVDLALANRLRADAGTRLTDRAALAAQTGPTVRPQQLVDRLRGDGVTAQLCSAATSDCVESEATPPGLDTLDGATLMPRPGPGPLLGGPPRGGPGFPPVRGRPAAVTPVLVHRSGPVLFTQQRLFGGRVLTLTTDTAQIGAVVRRLLVLEVFGGVLALAVVAVVLRRLSRLALSPLDEMTALARRIAAGDRGRRLGTGGDGSELGRTAAAFDGMLDELETEAARSAAAEARMRDFLGDAGHELRTPLTGISANAENLLRSPGDPAAVERSALAVARESRRAARLVQALLDLARLDHGLELDPQPVDLVELARAEMDRTAAIAPTLRLHLRGASGLVVRADGVRVSQIIANLLDNARAATGPNGLVEVVLGQTSAQTAGRALVSVRDDGPGIGPDDRERVFDRFTRLDRSRSRQTGGTGLGLAISRGIARAHGGDLVATGHPDGRAGAVLDLTLPLAVLPPPVPPPTVLLSRGQPPAATAARESGSTTSR